MIYRQHMVFPPAGRMPNEGMAEDSDTQSGQVNYSHFHSGVRHLAHSLDQKGSCPHTSEWALLYPQSREVPAEAPPKWHLEWESAR